MSVFLTSGHYHLKAAGERYAVYGSRWGEIHIGEPDLKPGDRLTVIDDGTRYAIETED